MFVRVLRFRFVSFTAFESLYAPRVPSFEWARVQGVWWNERNATRAFGRGCTTHGVVQTARQCGCNGGGGARVASDEIRRSNATERRSCEDRSMDRASGLHRFRDPINWLFVTFVAFCRYSPLEVFVDRDMRGCRRWVLEQKQTKETKGQKGDCVWGQRTRPAVGMDWVEGLHGLTPIIPRWRALSGLFVG